MASDIKFDFSVAVNGDIRYTGSDHGVDTHTFGATDLTANTSTLVNVAHTAHGFSDGTKVKFTGFTTFQGLVASELNAQHVITVTGTNGYDITVATAASGTGTGGGTGVLEYNGYHTVIQFHRYLQDLADDASSAGDDLLDITGDTPSDRSTDNIITLNGVYNIDNATAEHLYDGSIIQASGNDIWDGIVNFGSENTPIEVIQNGYLHYGTTEVLAVDQIDSVNTDATVTINLVDHGYIVGDTFQISGVDAHTGLLIAELNASHTVATVVDLDSFTFEIGSVATATVSDGGSAVLVRDKGVFELPTDSFALTSSSALVVVTHLDHGLKSGDEVTLEGFTSVNAVDSEMNKTHAISAVTADGYTITMSTNASGTDAADGGASVTVRKASFWNSIPATTVADTFESGPGLNRDSANGISHRFMIKVRDEGTDIDGRRILGINRSYGNTFGEFSINGTSRGNNVLALTQATDLNNASAEDTVGAISDIVNITSGYIGLDVDNDSADEFYYSQWDRGANSVNDLYEYAKYLTRRGSTGNLYGLNAELFRGITHEIDVDTPVGTFSPPELIEWSVGAGQLLAIDSTTAGTKIWIQLLRGVIPTDNLVMTGATSAATVTSELSGGSVTSRTISRPFIGASTGSALIGSYGLGVEIADLTSSDKVFDLTNTQKIPPNNVTFTLSGLVSGDRVLVGPESGGDILESQLGHNANVSSASVTSLVMDSAIPLDTPSAGTIRAKNSEGLFVRLPYSAYTGSTFTITSHDFDGVGQNADLVLGDDCYVSYIDVATGTTSEQFTGVYQSDLALFIRVRDGGGTPIKTFETTGTLASSGGSSTAIRTADD